MTQFKDLPIRTKFLLLLGLTFVIFMAIVVVEYRGLNSIRSGWDTYQAKVTKRVSLHAGIRNKFGYDGGIHSFKNFVIRGERGYQNRAREDFEQIKSLISQYRQLEDLGVGERTALTEIELVVNQYLRALGRAEELHAAGATVGEVDAACSVDDSPATRGFETLETAYQALSKKQTNEFSSTIIQSLIVLMFGLIVVFAILLVSQMTIGGSIATPLMSVVEAAKGMAGGDLREHGLKVKSDDEVGQVAEAFVEMRGGLRTLAAQTSELTGDVAGAAERVREVTHELAVARVQQATSVQGVASTLEEIVASGVESTNRANKVATTASATNSASDSGLEAIEATQDVMEGIREQVEEVALNIIRLSERTQAVEEIVSSVNGLAEQSNLLALNAAIEASEAGSEGARFSVVANEMKNLADQSRDATIRVRSILGDIQKGINTSVVLTEEAVKRVATGRDCAAVTKTAISDLASAIQESVVAFQQIIAASHQQQIGLEQVQRGMREISDSTDQLAVRSTELESAADQLNALGQQLRESVGAYRLE